MSADEPLLPFAAWFEELRERPAIGQRLVRLVVWGGLLRAGIVVALAAAGVHPLFGVVGVVGAAPVGLAAIGRWMAARSRDPDTRDAAIAWSWLEAGIAGVVAHLFVVAYALAAGITLLGR